MTNLHVSICIFQFALTFAAQVAAADPFAVPISGQPFPAELIAVDAAWQVTFRTGDQQYTMPAAGLVYWGQCSEQGRAGGLALIDGSWLAAEVVTADKQKLTVESGVFGTLNLALDTVGGIIFRPPSNSADRDRLFDRVVGRAGQFVSPRPTNLRSVPGEGQGVRADGDVGQVANLSHDILLLDNGDELAGQFIGLVDRMIKYETDVGPIDVKLDRVVAVLFKRSPQRKSPSAGSLHAWAGFHDGSRLLITQLLIQNSAVHLTVAGQPLAAPLDQLVFLQPLGGSAVYLSDLKPADYRQTPYLDLPWPYQPDRDVTGGFLRCCGRQYLKGLGVHSAARLVYEISPLPLAGEGPGVRAKRFCASLAIDDSTAGGGSVQFRILVDGQEKYVSPIIRGGAPPVPVAVDVTDAKKLELQVDYADRADVLDHADWLDARLERFPNP